MSREPFVAVPEAVVYGKKPMKVYLVGSLKDPEFPHVAEALREAGHDVFDDWRGGGHDGDARWRGYELNERGRGYVQAVYSPFAVNGRTFDRENIEASNVVVAVCKPGKLPGRSSIAELGHASKLRIRTVVLLNGEPEEWDLMLPLVVDHFLTSTDQLLELLNASH